MRVFGLFLGDYSSRQVSVAAFQQGYGKPRDCYSREREKCR